MYITGEKPGKGKYQCSNNHTITLDNDEDRLPPCPTCADIYWTKVG